VHIFLTVEMLRGGWLVDRGPSDLQVAFAVQDVLPPGLVGYVPLDGVGQPRSEVLARLPAQLGFEFGGFDEVAAVVVGPVGDVLDPVGGVFAEVAEDDFGDGQVGDLVPGADVVDGQQFRPAGGLGG
jgi:hypothetical protein